MMKLCDKKGFDAKKSVEECGICQITVGVARSSKDNKKVEYHLQKYCSHLPISKQEKCNDMMEMHKEAILDLLTRMEGSEICEKIGVCPRKQQHQVKLVGGERCTWGPSYWCQSKDHASICNATKHCQTKVWMADQPMPVRN